MRRHVAFYVHHQGRGHTTRARAVIDELDVPTTVLTSVPGPPGTFGDAEVVPLPRDDGAPEAGVPAPRPAHLHYAPIGVAGLRDRSAAITRVLAERAPAALVVDVSAEVAQLARLAGTPTVVMRQHGARWDAAHRAAYDGAMALLAPFGRELEEPDVPDDVLARTVHLGGLGRTPATDDGTRERARRALGWRVHQVGVVVLVGAGGDGPSAEDVATAAAATPGTCWIVVGSVSDRIPGVTTLGWVDDPTPYLAAADVVVGAAGHNTVMEVAALRRPFVCIPEDRPFDEQHRKAARLDALDLAEVHPSWPDAAAWPAVLEHARARGDALSRVVDPGAARRAADWITDLVDHLTSS